MFATASCLSTRCPVDSTRVLGWYRLYFLRFSLICRWESLNLTYTLKWFLFWKIFQYIISEQFWEQGVQGVFKPKLQKPFSQIFSLIFGATSLSFLSNIFCWLFGPRRLFLALRNLGRIASLFLEIFILQVTNPLFIENG